VLFIVRYFVIPKRKNKMESLTQLLTLAIKNERTRSPRVKLVTRLQAGKIKKQMYYIELTTKSN